MRHLKFIATALIAASTGALLVSGAKAKAPGDIMIDTMTRQYSNAHLIRQGENSFLFDAGYAKDAEKLDKKIRDLGVDPATLKAVIVSHGHHDHAGGALYFKERYNIPVIGGAGDTTIFETGQNDKLCPVGGMAKRRLKKDQTGTFTGYALDTAVETTLDLEMVTGISGQIYALPGHTSGSIVVTLDNAALVGDLVRGKVFNPRTATTHFYMCDLEDNRRDIRLVMDELAPSADKFYTGHFGPVSRKSLETLIAPDAQ